MHKHFQMSSYISRIFTINKPPEILFGHTMHLNVHIIHVGASIAVEVGFWSLVGNLPQRLRSVPTMVSGQHVKVDSLSFLEGWCSWLCILGPKNDLREDTVPSIRIGKNEVLYTSNVIFLFFSVWRSAGATGFARSYNPIGSVSSCYLHFLYYFENKEMIPPCRTTFQICKKLSG